MGEVGDSILNVARKNTGGLASAFAWRDYLAAPAMWKVQDVVELAGVTTVQLDMKGIDDEGVARLAAALEENTSVTNIDLMCE